MTTNSYSFLSWLRRGISTRIADGPGPGRRATVPVTLRVTGENVKGGGTRTIDVPHTVELYGPGDVIGVDPRAIVRTEPRDLVTNFEPNFLPFIEFYHEDFPWRYSPAGPGTATRRLLPWLALVVLTEQEAGATVTDPDRPLPFIEVPDLGVLPPADQLGAWAHVHVNRPVTASAAEVVSEDMAAVLPRLQAVLDENPDLACSRLVCPRRLAPDEGYHAFLVPAFETGRLAGLGLDPAGSPNALQSSWVPYPDRPEPGRLCYYHRWSFRTGTTGDFEYLVRLLKPRGVNARVGNRDMDVRKPGADLPGITNLGGILRLGGALKVPDSDLTDQEKEEAKRFEQWDLPYPQHPFQKALAALINLGDAYSAQSAPAAHRAARQAAVQGVRPEAGATGLSALADDVDPVVTPPLYGRWHALTNRLLTDRNGAPLEEDENWVHRLNLDPRFRVAAGFGTEIVRQYQEEFMQAAWEQIGEVLEANRRIRAAQLAREVAFSVHTRQLEPLRRVARDRGFTVDAPVHGRLLGDRVTVAHRVSVSPIATAPVSAAMRRITRPGSRLMRRLPAPPAPPPPPPSHPGPGGAVVFDTPGPPPPPSVLSRLDDGKITAAPEKKAPTGTVLVENVEHEVFPPGPHFGKEQTEAPLSGDPVGTLPKSPDFVVSLPGEDVHPHMGDTDSPEAVRFKTALQELYQAFGDAAASGSLPPRTKAGLGVLAAVASVQLHPDLTMARRVLGGITIPSGGPALAAEPEVSEIMAYPVIDLPMYKPLIDRSAELFLPNLNLVPPNSITLLETNPRFIEAYLAGLNHEMARELLWREFPTDQRGSTFRQFWDVSVVLPRPGEDPRDARERLRDVPPLHTWGRRAALGDQYHRQASGPVRNELVLVIRGELLKKYPTAVIYAHRAVWQGPPGPGRQRRLITLADEDHPQRSEVRMPVFDAKAEPDVYFFGFDLTEEEALGDSGEQPEDDAGWFFVIKERPGEPRFGLDLSRDGALEVWNDLAWPDVRPTGKGYIPLAQGSPTLTLTAPPPERPEKAEQHAEDRSLTWNPNISAADAAYLLYQAPVLVAVHAREMLKHE
ncbi:hypothetical protein AB0K09_20585 [Streptomyces sp. NPDC049577]|uniref:hypothetical protein n=1 Tax=Streptomyces sp. NPDC049577 TaxID=3155153 RepID=UPI0034467FD1